MSMKTITFKLSEISVLVDDNGLSKEELMRQAQEAVLAQMQEKFPRYTYSVNEGEALPVTMPEVGAVVKHPSTGEYGITVKVNPKTMDVAFDAFKVLRGSPMAFLKVEAGETDVDTILWGKATRNGYKEDQWGLYDTGFIKESKSGEVFPIIITNITGNYPNETFKAQIVGDPTRYFRLSKQALSTVKATREEAMATGTPKPKKKAK